MQVEVKVPQLSESVSEATLVAWRKKAGEPVKRDENLIDVETDKVVLELPAPSDGVLARILKKDGDSVTSGEVIAVIDTEAKATAAPAQTAVTPAEPAPARSKPGAGAPPEAPHPARKAAPWTQHAPPSATRAAAEKGMDAGGVQGRGRDGGVTRGDVPGGAHPAAAKPAAPPVQLPTGARTEQRVP